MRNPRSFSRHDVGLRVKSVTLNINENLHFFLFLSPFNLLIRVASAVRAQLLYGLHNHGTVSFFFLEIAYAQYTSLPYVNLAYLHMHTVYVRYTKHRVLLTRYENRTPRLLRSLVRIITIRGRSVRYCVSLEECRSCVTSSSFHNRVTVFLLVF